MEIDQEMGDGGYNSEDEYQHAPRMTYEEWVRHAKQSIRRIHEYGTDF
jgi:hypothetical protein